jgi:hypothetical protein
MDIFKRLKDNVMGTPEQNKAAQERMDKAKEKQEPVKKNRDELVDDTSLGIPGTYRPATKEEIDGAVKRANDKKSKNMKAGGKVSSASKRADGCAVKGKTRGRMV